MGKSPLRIGNAYPPPSKWTAPQPRRPMPAGVGRLRKIAFLGGSKTLSLAPWHDPSWELWAHMSCRHRCKREPDVLFDMHPEALWRNPKKKTWDPTYLQWLQQNHIPIYMQDRYKDVPSSMKYPFQTMITEFPRGYMTNSIAYMFALALMEGVTHIALYGCHYESNSEYGPQRGCAEYWCGVAEGRGVHVLIPPGCDLLNKPDLLYGYESHPDGKRHPSYAFAIGTPVQTAKEAMAQEPMKRDNEPVVLVPANDPSAPPLMDLGVPVNNAWADGIPADVLEPEAVLA